MRYISGRRWPWRVGSSKACSQPSFRRRGSRWPRASVRRKPWEGISTTSSTCRTAGFWWRLAPEDALILYTDGVLDAKWNERDRLGEARLAELLSRTAPAGAGEWVNRLRRALDGCVARPDDVTIVAIRREPLHPRCWRSIDPMV